MSEEDFLSRWSRRKSEVANAGRSSKAPAESATPPKSVEAPPAADRKTAGSAKSSDEEEFDLSLLPPIDSITASTDITAFFHKGVPIELTRAALRRAWVADPAIRDFVGLAENAWDFNDPNAMAGFGALDQTPEQVRRLVSAIMGEVRREVDAIDPAVAKASDQGPQDGDCSALTESSVLEVQASSVADETVRVPEQTLTHDSDAAAQNEPAETPRLVHRTHGGALPR